MGGARLGFNSPRGISMIRGRPDTRDSWAASGVSAGQPATGATKHADNKSQARANINAIILFQVWPTR